MTGSAHVEQTMIVRCPDPLNAEPAPARLVAGFLTAQADFYIRNHGTVPDMASDHRVLVDGLVRRPMGFTLDDLRAGFAERTVIATLQCAGNRRAEFQRVGKTKGDPWAVGAIGNAAWTGVALSDLLAAAGVQSGACHVAFTGADEVEVDGDRAAYGVSIPLDKAIRPDVMIAWAINGEPLLPHHGAPLRIVVPGYAGVRSVKWLSRIEVRDKPSQAPIQARDYKLFPASVAADDADWDQGLTINEMPLNSAICDPVDGATMVRGQQILRGYAIAYGRAVVRVEVSTDGGVGWRQADLTRDEESPGAWSQWQIEVDLNPGSHMLMVRAFDDAGQGQPEWPGHLWNFAGYLCSAWHRVRIHIE